MKIKDYIILAVLVSLLIFVPFPSLVLKVLYYLDFGIAFIILEICIFNIFRKTYPKRIPKALPGIIKYFCFYTIPLNLSTVKLIINMKSKPVFIPLISEYAESAFNNFPYTGYLIFACMISALIVLLYKTKKLENEQLENSFKIFRASIKIFICSFIVAFAGGTLKGILHNNLSVLESIKFYLSYSCAEILFYFLNLNLVCLGIDSLLEVIRSDTKFFSTL